MRNKLCKLFKRIYGITMSIAFWGGIIPLAPFIVAFIVGGTYGEKIVLFFYNKYYKVIIILASISVVIGLISMYLGKQKSLSTESFEKNK